MELRFTSTSNLILLLIVIISFTNCKSEPKEIPLVYDVEFTGSNYPAPPLYSVDKLPSIKPLPDPFIWANGSGRDTTFTSWEHHRADYKAMIEHYEIGKRPPLPDDIKASYTNGELTVVITRNDSTLTLTSKITLPEGKGPFPAVIGIGRGSGSLPSEIFSTRNIAQISFDFRQIMAHQQKRGSEPINKLFPELTYIGAYSAWPWGISRLIDGLEQVQDSLPIDLKHLAVTGCSFAGKMALFTGAFDERIALTIAQESGGGGYPAWRVSETLGKVETLARTDSHWFIKDMWQFAEKVDKLPYDHHQLMAMVAPRALLVTGNPDYEWLADPSGYVSSRATQKIYKTLGIEDRFGFSIVAKHRHCLIPESQIPEIEAFVDKFMLGIDSVNTKIRTHPYPDMNYKRWTAWWGKEKLILPALD
jgi:hypothetical protein